MRYGLCENDEFPVVFCKVALTKKEAGIETGGSKMSAASAFLYGDLTCTWRPRASCHIS